MQFLPFNTPSLPDVMCASVDALVLAMGHTAERPHPLAGVINAAGTLPNVAKAAGQMAGSRRPPGMPRDDRAYMFEGIKTADFGNAAAQAGTKVSINAYASQSQHLNFCGRISARNFNPFDQVNHYLDLVPQPKGEIQEFQIGTVEAAGGASGLQLVSFARVLEITRKAVVNNDIDALAMMFTSFGASTSRLEGKLVAEAMEATANLDDGFPVFHTDFGNVLGPSDQTLDENGLAAAMKLLRTQRIAGGQLVNLELRHLVVEPNLEFAARKLVRDSDMNVRVSVLADLPAGRWFAMADQAQAPTISVLRLEGAKTPIVIGRTTTPDTADGTRIKAICDTGAAFVNRIGIVRGGA